MTEDVNKKNGGAFSWAARGRLLLARGRLYLAHGPIDSALGPIALGREGIYLAHGPLYRARGAPRPSPWANLSDEHTSELQSMTNLVCLLLLDKQNKPAL